METFGANAWLLGALNNHAAEYMVVGGLAVKFYCPERTVRDLDLLVNATQENLLKAGNALRQLELEGLVSPQELQRSLHFKGHGKVLRLRAVMCADVFLAKRGYDFDSVYASTIKHRVSGQPVSIISISDLITYKETDDDPELREKNQLDLQMLRQVTGPY